MIIAIKLNKNLMELDKKNCVTVFYWYTSHLDALIKSNLIVIS